MSSVRGLFLLFCVGSAPQELGVTDQSVTIDSEHAKKASGVERKGVLIYIIERQQPLITKTWFGKGK